MHWSPFIDLHILLGPQISSNCYTWDLVLCSSRSKKSVCQVEAVQWMDATTSRPRPITWVCQSSEGEQGPISCIKNNLPCNKPSPLRFRCRYGNRRSEIHAFSLQSLYDPQKLNPTNIYLFLNCGTQTRPRSDVFANALKSRTVNWKKKKVITRTSEGDRQTEWALAWARCMKCERNEYKTW